MAGLVFGTACSSRLLFVCGHVGRGVSVEGLRPSACLSRHGLEVVHGEVTMVVGVMGLSRPQIVMLSVTSSMIVSTCVEVPSCNSSCGNCNVPQLY